MLSAPVANEAYLSVFEQEKALDRFEAFAALNRLAFYGFAPDERRVTYIRHARAVASTLPVENDEIVPYSAALRLTGL